MKDCRKPADLVYKRDVTDDDRVVHRKGKKSGFGAGSNPSNYTYIRNVDKAYKDYVFASDAR